MKQFAATVAVTALLTACGAPDTDQGDTVVSNPGATDRPEATRTTTDQDEVRDDLLAMAERDGRFTTLLAAIEAAGLSDALREDDFTLLAPTDAAFAALPEGTVETLLEPGNRGQLADILRYHVLTTPVRAGDIDGADDAPTLAGVPISVERVGERVLIGGEGGAVVTDADIEAGNGIVHAIDSVLLPPA